MAKPIEINNLTKDDLKDGRDEKIPSSLGPPPKMRELKYIGIFRKGSVGTICYMEHIADQNKPQRAFALKVIKKKQVIDSGIETQIKRAKTLMQNINNKWLVNLFETYNDPKSECVFLLLDACLGGELFTILRQKKSFDEPTARFYAASVVEAFNYMHSKNIIYRILMPENLLLDMKGYIKLCDFKYAKKLDDLKDDNCKTYTLCGTPDYLAPEIVTGHGHNAGVDWWCLGILIFEMLASFPPFYADQAIETYNKIIRGNIKFLSYFSQQAVDLITGLLHHDSEKRLGMFQPDNGDSVDLIRNHTWFERFDWKALDDGTLEAPLKATPYHRNSTGKDEIEFEWPLYWDREEISMVIDYWYRELISVKLSIDGIIKIMVEYFVNPKVDDDDKDELGAHFESMWKDGQRVF